MMGIFFKNGDRGISDFCLKDWNNSKVTQSFQTGELKEVIVNNESHVNE